MFFQGGRSRRRHDGTVAQSRPEREVQEPSAGTSALDAALQLASHDVRELVDAALSKAGLTPTDAARIMGVSLSLFLRQLQNVEKQHLSLQRLWLLPDVFWRELFVLLAKRRKLARAQQRLVFDIELEP